jgi:protein-disulfide isomerase
MTKSKPSAHKEKVRQQKQRQKQLNRNLSIGIIAVVVIALVIASWPEPEPEPLPVSRMGSDPALGVAGAPIVIIEYGDFGCPACRVWHQAGIRDQILEEYRDQVQFVWRDYPVITAQSPKAAEAGQCAFDQNKFWEFHDYLYEKANSLSIDNLKAYAREIGLDSEQFDQCIDSGKNKAKVDASMQQGFDLGFPGAPGFVVNDQKLPGPPMYETLKGIIDKMLATQ